MGLLNWIYKLFNKEKVEIAYQYTKNDDIDFEKPDIVKLCSTAIPSKTGLYPHEIHMLCRAEKYSNGNNDFPKYWYYSYGIDNPQTILDKLYSEGYIKLCSLENALEKIPMAEIRSEMQHFGLPTKRKKKDMIDILLADGDLDYLNSKYSYRTFVYTDKGTLELKENEYIQYILRMQFNYIDIWTANKLVNQNPIMNYKDAFWGYFNKIAVDFSIKGEYGLARNTYLEMTQLCMDEKRWQQALMQLSAVFYSDLSSLGNGFNLKYEKLFYKSNIEHYFPYENSILRLAPACIQYLIGIQNELALSDDDLRMYLDKYIPEKSLPFHLFTKEECIEIILAEKNNDLTITKDISNKAKKRYIKYFK